jgi:sulfur relay (sulfurtransferase) DsrC/TusE family protein
MKYEMYYADLYLKDPNMWCREFVEDYAKKWKIELTEDAWHLIEYGHKQVLEKGETDEAPLILRYMYKAFGKRKKANFDYVYKLFPDDYAPPHHTPMSIFCFLSGEKDFFSADALIFYKWCRMKNIKTTIEYEEFMGWR